MRKLLSLALLVVASMVSHAQDLPTTQIKNVSTGKKMPFNHAVAKDRITVISFWATWCAPCKKEIKNISSKLEGWKKEVDFDYMTVSIDEARAEGIMRTYVISQGWDFPYFIDPNSDLKRSLNFQSVPFTLIVGKDGKIAWRHIGYEEGGENEVIAKVKELAGVK